MEKSLRLSVHQLVDFLLRSGDIDNRVFNRSSMTEGSRLHSVYQSKQSSNYMSEYPLSINLTVDEIDILLEGRADGIIKRSDGTYVIDEIKTTVEELEKFHQDNLEWPFASMEGEIDIAGVREGVDIASWQIVVERAVAICNAKIFGQGFQP